MGIIGFILKAFLKVAKPFLKQAMIESIMEIIAEYAGTGVGGSSITSELQTDAIETLTIPELETTDF